MRSVSATTVAKNTAFDVVYQRLGGVSETLLDEKTHDPSPRTSVCVRVCVCFLPIHSGHQVRWTYQPGSHRRKVTQDF